MSEEKILPNAPGMDYFYANTFATSPQMGEHFYFLWLQLFSLNIEWYSFPLISLFIAAAYHTPVNRFLLHKW